MRNKKWISGQGLVEFALILPILLLLVVGALDFGRAFYMKTVMENSAREGAYYMANHTDEGKATASLMAYPLHLPKQRKQRKLKQRTRALRSH